METNKDRIKALEKIYSDIDNDFSPLKNELKALSKLIYNEKSSIYSKEKPIFELIKILTKTSKRKILNFEIPKEDIEFSRIKEIGLNHNGLSVVTTYLSNLVPLCSDNYEFTQREREKLLRDILKNEKITDEILLNIPKRNQKTFMELTNIIRKNGLEDIKEYIDNLKSFLKIETEKFIFYVDVRYENHIEIDIEEIGSSQLNSLNFYSNKEEKFSIFNITKSRGSFPYPKIFTDTEHENIIKAVIVLDNQEPIVDKIKQAREKYDKIFSKYYEEQDKFKDILKPFLALEEL